MKTITIDKISDANFIRIEKALKSAYETDTVEEAIRQFIDTTVINVEAEAIRTNLELEAKAAYDAVIPIKLSTEE